MRLFWQFANGTVARSTALEILRALSDLHRYEYDYAWDRSLAAWVYYER